MQADGTNARIVADSLDLLAEYGGMDPATKGKAEDWVVLDYLP